MQTNKTTCLYNPAKKYRVENPENSRRLVMRGHTMLNQRASVDIDGKRVWNTLKNLIQDYPEAVFNHVYNYRKKELIRIILDSTGRDLLYKELDIIGSYLIIELRRKKLHDKAVRNVKKKLNSK